MHIPFVVWVTGLLVIVVLVGGFFGTRLSAVNNTKPKRAAGFLLVGVSYAALALIATMLWVMTPQDS